MGMSYEGVTSYYMDAPDRPLFGETRPRVSFFIVRSILLSLANVYYPLIHVPSVNQSKCIWHHVSLVSYRKMRNDSKATGTISIASHKWTQKYTSLTVSDATLGCGRTNAVW